MQGLLQLVVDDSGQDLIEYALLTTLIGLCALLAFNGWNAAINGTYSSWNTQVNTLWDPAIGKQ